MQITDAFDLMLEAIDNANNRESQAENAKEDVRFTQRVLTRVVSSDGPELHRQFYLYKTTTKSLTPPSHAQLNKLNSMVELSDTQVAASLLGLSSGLCSDKFCGVDVTRYMKYIANQKTGGALEILEETEEERSEDDPEDDGGSEGDFIAEEDENGAPSEEAAFDLEAMLKEKETLDALAEAANEEGGPAYPPGPPRSPDGSSDEDDEGGFDCPFEIKAEKSPFGPGTVYTTNEEVHHSVTYPEKYFNRGEGLKDLTLDEYLRLVRIERIRGEDKDEDKQPNAPIKRGRKSNGRFPFAEGFDLKESHIQVLRSKHCTLKFFKGPPGHPGPEPPANKSKKHESWRKQANKYGLYYLTLFRPEKRNFGGKTFLGNREQYDWEAFVGYVRMLRDSALQINKLRLERMECVAHSWKSKVKNRKMLADLRGKDRDMWNKDQQAEYKNSLSRDDGSAEKKFDKFFEEHDEEREAQELSLKKQTEIISTVFFSDGIKERLGSYHSGLSESGGPSPRPHGGKVRHGGPSVRLARSEPAIASELKKAKRKRDDHGAEETAADTDPRRDEDSPSSSDDGEDDGSLPDGDSDNDNRSACVGRMASRRGPQHLEADTAKRIRNENADRYLASRTMSADQRSVVDTMRSHFDALNDGTAKDGSYEAPVLLITGGPGVGKSYVVHTLAGLAKEMDAGDQVRMAYIGIAAVGIDGYSACSLMDIPTEFDKRSREKARRWKTDRLSQFNQKFNPEKISCVIFDEISTVKPEVLGFLNYRLQEATQCWTKPFGGLALIMLGDFDQMKPVGASCTIPATIMKREGGLDKKVKKHTLREDGHQVTKIGGMGLEMFKKARHMRLEQQHRSLDADHTNLLAKMSRGERLEYEDLDSYKLLGEGAGSDEDFRFATVLVSSNRNRRRTQTGHAAVASGVASFVSTSLTSSSAKLFTSSPTVDFRTPHSALRTRTGRPPGTGNDT